MADIGLTPFILEAVKRPQGLKCDHSHGFDSTKLGQRACHMADHLKLIFRAKMAHRDVRFFDTAERAQAYEAAHKGLPGRRLKPLSQREVRIADTLAIGKHMAEAKAAFKSSNQSGYTVTAADEAKIVRIPTPANMGNRAYVDPASVPVYRYGGGV